MNTCPCFGFVFEADTVIEMNYCFYSRKRQQCLHYPSHVVNVTNCTMFLTREFNIAGHSQKNDFEFSDS